MEEEKKIEVKKELEKKKQEKSKELALRRESPFSLFQRMDRYFDDYLLCYHLRPRLLLFLIFSDSLSWISAIISRTI